MLIVGTVALIVAAPASVVLGAPLIWVLHRPLRRRPLAGTVALAMIGMIAAIPINGFLNDGDAEHDLWTAMLFGGVVAGAHGVVLAHRTWRRWSQTVTMAGAAALIGSVAGRLMLDAFWNGRAAQAAEACARGYDFSSHVTARDRLPALARAQGRSFEQGRWSIRSPNPALFGRYSAVFVNGVRTLVAEDVAYVPIRPWHRLGASRTTAVQCLLTADGPDAALVRGAGLIRPFR